MDKLSKKILIKIFEYLTVEDKENLILVCESWRNILATSPSLMKRHHLKIDFKTLISDEKPWLRLPYRNFYFERICDRNKDAFESFTSDIKDVDKVVIKSFKLTEVVKFSTHFDNISMLITEVFWGEDSKDTTFINLPNLTHFKFGIRSFDFLPKIKNHKVKFMHVNSNGNSVSLTEMQTLGEFLQDCKDLKHLTLEGFYTDEVLKIKSQLETFEVIKLDEMIPQSVKNFLEVQKSSLKNLTLSGTLNAALTNFILFEMNLERLIFEKLKFFDIKAPKKMSLKNLSIVGDIFNQYQFEKLPQHLESLEVLSMILSDPLDYVHLLSMLPKLKVLYLKFRQSNSFACQYFNLDIKFNHLEKLSFSSGLNKYECLNIICCCPHLKWLEMRPSFGNELNVDDFGRIFDSCKEIQEIKIIGSIKKDEELQTLKIVGDKINIKFEVYDQSDYEKLLNMKNRLTVTVKNYQEESDPFEVTPLILKHSYLENDRKIHHYQKCYYCLMHCEYCSCHGFRIY